MLILPILAIVLLFSLSIFVHELGHFLAARALGMVADVFSIGLGPAIWKRKIGATVWKIGAIPFGGYVALPQMDPNSLLEGEAVQRPKSEDQSSNPSAVGLQPPVSLPRVAPWKKIVVSVAGAFGNIVFAFLLATVVWIVGKPASLQERSAVVGYVAVDSPAAAAGLAPGDEVMAVDGRPVATWIELAEKAALAPADSVELRVRTPAGDERDLSLEVVKLPVGIRVLPGIDGRDICEVAAVSPGSGAEAAGLQAGDRIVRFDGQPVYSRSHMSQLVDATAGRPAEIVFRRAGREESADVTARPDAELERYLIGIRFNTMGDLDFETRSHPTPWAQVKSHAGAIFRFLDALTTPATSGAAADAVGGPVLILIMLLLMLRSSFMLAVWFTGFLNVNLAILNLLPIPVLDGGHVLLNLYEWVFRRPLPPRIVNALINVFAVLFILLFLSLTYRDVVRQIVPPLRRWLGG